MNKIQPPVSPAVMAKKLGQVPAVKGIQSFLHVSHEIYIVTTMHCLSIVYPNPNLPNPYSSHCLLLHQGTRKPSSRTGELLKQKVNRTYKTRLHHNNTDWWYVLCKWCFGTHWSLPHDYKLWLSTKHLNTVYLQHTLQGKKY